MVSGYKGENCDRREGFSILSGHMLRYVIIGLISLILFAILVFGSIQMKRKGRSVEMNI
jgi:hypothetical protein